MGRFSKHLAAMAAIAAACLNGCEGFAPDPDPNPALRFLEARASYETPGAPYAVAASDLSGNGWPDLLAVHPDDDAISVRLSAANGRYGAPVALPGGQGPTALIVGDFNGDGNPDVLVANTAGGDLSFYPGLGGGELGEELRLGLLLNAEPVALAAADLTGNGAADIVVADNRRQSLQILLGLGEGAFLEDILELDTEAGPRSIAIGDLNGDGNPDIAVAERESDTVRVFLGDGRGNFDEGTAFDTGTNPRMVQIADLNGDGLPDLVTTNPGSREVLVHFGGGSNLFMPPVATELPFTPTRFAAGDFNGNGRTDLAIVAFGTGDAPVPLGQIAMLFGNGEGGFAAPRYFGVGAGALDVAAVDFDNSGRQDLVTADTAANRLSAVLNRGNGRFTAEERFPAGDWPRAVVAGDFNGDGRQDLAVANLESGDLSILLGQGDGTFLPETRVPVSGTPRAIALGNINGNNHLDLVVTSLTGNQASVLLGRGDGTFQNERVFSIRRPGENRASQPRSVTLADMNQDGNLDMVVGNAGTDTVAVLFGDGNGNFGEPEEFFVGNFPLAVHTGDLNRDGYPDVIVVNGNDPEAAGGSPGRVSTVHGDGEGGLDTDTRRAVATGANPRDMVVLDLDGDGNLDAATVEQATHRVFVHNGQGAVIAPGNGVRTGQRPNAIAAARLSSTVLPDLLTTNDDNTVSVLRNIGGRSFLPSLNYPAGDGPISPVFTDLTGNGIPDLVFCNRGSGDISVVLGRR